MKWIDLFQFLNKQANELNNFGKFNWQDRVTIYDASSGEKYYCDTYRIKNNQATLVINLEKFGDNI